MKNKKKTRIVLDFLDELLGGGEQPRGVRFISLPAGMGKSDAMLDFMKHLAPGKHVFFVAHHQDEK